MMSCNIPNQSASGVAYQTEEHQKTNEDIKQQQAEVTQPPVYIQTHHIVSYKQIHKIRSATNYYIHYVGHSTIYQGEGQISFWTQNLKI